MKDKKSDKTTEEKWTASLTITNDIPNEPEDYGTVLFNLPFCYRLRFAIVPLQGREPSIGLYEDYWDNNLRCWTQKGRAAFCIGVSTLRYLIELLEEELANER